MTEEKNTPSIEENKAPIKENINISGAAVPPEKGDILPVAASSENNSLATQAENYPEIKPERTLNVEQAKEQRTLTAEELKAKRYQSGLTVEEAKKLEDMEAENNAEGKLSQENGKDIPYRDIKPHKLEEGDIIEVMYKGLISDIMNVDAWVSKHLWHAYDKMIYNADKRKNDKNAEKAAQEAAKDKDKSSDLDISQDKSFNLEKAHAKKQEEIKTQTEQDLSKVEKISQAINKGTLFNKENKDLLSDFEKITKADEKQGKATYNTVKQACESKEENKEAREKAAKEFFAYNAGAIWFNCINQTAANNMAYAEVSHRSKHENMNAKQMEREFTSAHSSYNESINKNTAKEQQEAKEKISKSPLLDEKVISNIDLGELYKDSAPRSRSLEKMGKKAVEYAHINSNISERNPYINGVRHITGMPKLQEKEQVFSGGSLKDAVNYMKELRHDTLQITTPLNNHDQYMREMTGNHIQRLKNAQSNEEIIKRLREKNGGR